MTRIFISYRRSDTIGHTGRIYDRLVTEFGQGSVFMDVDDIPIGVDFAEHIAQEVGKCQVALVVIGKTWATVTGADGSRRLDNPDDFVRIEVESALARGVPVVPVLLDGVSIPMRSQLPESLHPLTRRNGVTVGYNPRFNGDMARLIRGLNGLMRAVEMAPEPIVEELAEEDDKRFLDLVGYRKSQRRLHGELLRIHQKARQTIDFVESRKSFSHLKTQTISGDLGNDIFLDLVKIPSGTFLMGSPEDERGRTASEGPQHEVMVPTFLMGQYPVTQAQWRAVAVLPKIERNLNPDPSCFKGADRPVEKVSWLDAVEFCQRLSNHTGKDYRLPSEAEWEYACRSGTTTPYFFGEELEIAMSNHSKGERETTDVGRYPANDFGLHDMHGNVWEWCQDHWHSNYQDAPMDGSPWLTGTKGTGRIRRGGSWLSIRVDCRSANRYVFAPSEVNFNIGFRVSCSVPKTLT